MSTSPLIPPDDRDVVHAAGGSSFAPATPAGGKSPWFTAPSTSTGRSPRASSRLTRARRSARFAKYREETGFVCHLGRFVGQVEYADRRGRLKVVSYWLMQPVDGAFEPTAEVDELRWPTLADAFALLSYSHDRDLLESVQTP